MKNIGEWRKDGWQSDGLVFFRILIRTFELLGIRKTCNDCSLIVIPPETGFNLNKALDFMSRHPMLYLEPLLVPIGLDRPLFR